MIYRYDGVTEERRAIAWMKSQLLHIRERRVQGQAEAIDELIGYIDSRLAALPGDGVPRGSDFNEEMWDKFIFAVSGRWANGDDPDDSVDDEIWEPPHVWGEWELSGTQEIKLGYSQSLLRTSIPRGGGSPVHFYSKPPTPVQWDLTPIRQKAVSFLIGKARICDIDAVCSVPQLPEEIDSAESGLRVLDPTRGDQEWQRRIEAKRVLAIRNFIGERGNIIANSAILYAPDSPAFSWESNGHVRVDFSRFLQRIHGEWTDRAGKRDLRPVWLIDGQHRVRGIAQSKEGIDLEIPIILFTPEFSLGQSAKIFAEINTLQKKLSPLHTLFMQHRFGIPSTIPKRDFTRPWGDGKPSDVNSRANHLAYECAAYLTSHEGGPLYNRIRMLDQNSAVYAIMQASQWVDFSRSWYLPGQVYGPDRPETREIIWLEVENYFSAFVRTCNHDGWKDGRPRWSPTSKNKGLLQRQGPSQALLRMYPTVWMVARRGHTESPIPVERFLSALRPLTWVDWLNTKLHDTFARGGETGRSAIRVWMETAVRHSHVYPQEEVMAEDRHSQPGRGVLSSPGKGTLELASDVDWPDINKPLRLRASQPINTLPGSRWEIIDSEKNNRTPEASLILAEGNLAELEVGHEDWMNDCTYIDVRVDWYNAVDPPGGATLHIERPVSAPKVYDGS